MESGVLALSSEEKCFFSAGLRQKILFFTQSGVSISVLRVPEEKLAVHNFWGWVLSGGSVSKLAQYTKKFWWIVEMRLKGLLYLYLSLLRTFSHYFPCLYFFNTWKGCSFKTRLQDLCNKEAGRGRRGCQSAMQKLFLHQRAQKRSMRMELVIQSYLTPF